MLRNNGLFSKSRSSPTIAIRRERLDFDQIQMNLLTQPLRILIVDDTDMNRLMLQRLLVKRLDTLQKNPCYQNAEVVLASDGEHAIKLVQQSHKLNKPFGLIFMDEQMGVDKKSGTQTSHAILKDQMANNAVESYIVQWSASSIKNKHSRNKLGKVPLSAKDLDRVLVDFENYALGKKAAPTPTKIVETDKNRRYSISPAITRR